FTEHGVLMLANIIKSERAIKVSIKIIELFVKLREMLATHTELKLEIEQIKKKIDRLQASKEKEINCFKHQPTQPLRARKIQEVRLTDMNVM
ncbi:MAG: hypothetical protein KA285_02910, partial [Bacteroidia bacterium]|nr:hypothetical protein [Bacteroidia bacterium]